MDANLTHKERKNLRDEYESLAARGGPEDNEVTASDIAGCCEDLGINMPRDEIDGIIREGDESHSGAMRGIRPRGTWPSARCQFQHMRSRRKMVRKTLMWWARLPLRCHWRGKARYFARLSGRDVGRMDLDFMLNR
eukprot:COSAG02_NODE_3838_length_6163_cov_26.286115_2_plen_136_part_00